MKLRKQNAAFTLLEIMLVVAIIALLVGAATYYFAGNIGFAKDVRVKQDLSTISTALNVYMSSNTNYPTDEQGLKALLYPPDSDPKPRQWRKLLKSDSDLKDPWGHDYIYSQHGTHNTDSFDLYSSGPDGVPNTADDIGNWDAPQSKQ